MATNETSPGMSPLEAAHDERSLPILALNPTIKHHLKHCGDSPVLVAWMTNEEIDEVATRWDDLRALSAQVGHAIDDERETITNLTIEVASELCTLLREVRARRNAAAAAA